MQVDLVICNAGIYRTTAKNGDSIIDYANEAVDINLKGVMNTILPFIPKMKVCDTNRINFQEAGFGQICVVGSSSGNGTLGIDPVYEGTKNAVRVTLEGLMAPLENYGIHLSLVSPGNQ